MQLHKSLHGKMLMEGVLGNPVLISNSTGTTMRSATPCSSPAAAVSYFAVHCRMVHSCCVSEGHSSTSCYADKKLPINQIKEQLDLVWSETHNIPHLDPSGMEGKCIFTATRNILARLVGGFDASTICLDTLPSTVDKNIHCCGDAIGCLGSFVQIEQNSLSRDAGRYNDWAAAINKAFPI